MALTLQRKPFDVGRIVLIWLFTRLAPWKLGPARALTALTPTSLFRMAIPAVARLVFEPTGGDRDFPFFTSLTHGTASETTRRVGWMIGADFASTFTALPPVPTRVWFGTRDR